MRLLFSSKNGMETDVRCLYIGKIRSETHRASVRDREWNTFGAILCDNRITIVERACNNLGTANSTYLTQFMRWNFAHGLPWFFHRNSLNSFHQFTLVLAIRIMISGTLETLRWIRIQKRINERLRRREGERERLAHCLLRMKEDCLSY